MTLPTTEIITSTQAVTDLCADVRATGWFAFDTEFVMETSYQAEVCLAQVATDSRIALIDPLAGADLDEVWALVVDPDVECIVHAGSEDLAICHRSTGKTPTRVFDSQVVAGMVGYDYPISLMRLVNEITGVRLHKSQTLTDWRARPLADVQIEYAAEDVGYLPDVRKHLGDRLATLGREEWARDELSKFECPATYVRHPAQDVLRLKGARSLDRQQLVVARELLKIREQMARKRNRPARTVIRDHLLIEIARHKWTDPAQIRTLRGMQLPMRALAELGDAVKRALAMPRDEWPKRAPTTKPDPRADTLVSLLSAAVRDYCAERELAYALLTTKQQLSSIVETFLRNGGLDDANEILPGWRGDAIGELLVDLLSGRRAVRVGSAAQNHRLVVE
ncbi:MAG: HRDC domain-containing protein [Planctomycetes bacterium]|nr:HRDC domain-containing protein [Planctomycetota bacterium]